MSCNDINGILGSSCIKSMGGLKNVWVFPFDDISEYIYTSDDLNHITGYSSVSYPVQYVPNYNTSEYSASRSLSDYKMYDHSLSLSFSKMEKDKRDELIKLESMELTIIFQDRNDKCWIMGQDYPVKLTVTEVRSGVKGGDSSYKLTFSSTEKNHLREIECPSDRCFVSFKGIERRESTIVVPAASTLTWQEFEIGADDQILSYTSSYVLDPTLWSNPTNKLNDLTQLSHLINQYGTPVVPNSTLLGSYDSMDDEVTLTIISDNTSYGGFKVDGVVFSSSVSITLNLTTILSPFISNSSTIINLDDSLGNIYNEGYGLSVAAAGITGISNNVVINVSDLYPTGTTFTLSIDGLPCATAIYEYVYEPTISPCGLYASTEFFKGQLCSLFIPHVEHAEPTCPKYQNIHLNIFGQIYTMYTIYTTWHDDDTQFETDIVNLLDEIGIIIDTNSFTYDYGSNGARITFKILSVDVESIQPFFKSFVRGFDQPVNENTAWINARVLNINTAAPYPSIITIEDEFGNEIEGENIVNITSNSGFLLDEIPTTSNTTVDNIGIVWTFDEELPYIETSLLTVNSDSGECISPTLSVPTISCPAEAFDSSFTHTLQKVYLDVTGGSVNAGKFYTIVTNTQTINIVLGSTVSPNENMHLLTHELNKVKGLQVIHMDYNPLLRRYNIYFRIDSGTTLVSFTETTTSRAFTLGTVYQLYTNTLDSKMNPNIKVNYTSIPTTFSSSPTGLNNLSIGHWQEQLLYSTAIEVAWDQGADTIVVTKGLTAPSTVDTSYTVTLHEDYPTSTNSKLTILLPAATADITENSVSTTLIANGSDVGDINYVAYTNYMGWRYIKDINLSGVSDLVIFEEYERVPVLWGTMDYLQYAGSGSTDVADVIISSTTCVDDCCDDLVTPDASMTDITWTYTGVPDYWTAELEFNTSVLCDITTVTIELIPDLLSPTIDSPAVSTFITDGCIGGVRHYTATEQVLFTADPTGFGYTQQIDLYDVLGNNLGSYTKPITF